MLSRQATTSNIAKNVNKAAIFRFITAKLLISLDQNDGFLSTLIIRYSRPIEKTKNRKSAQAAVGLLVGFFTLYET